MQRIVAVYRRTAVYRVFNDRPFDGQGSAEPRTCPIGPFFIEHLAAAVEQLGGAFWGLGADASLGISAWREQ